MNQKDIKNIISKMRVSDTPETDKVLATELHGPYPQDRMFDMLKKHAKKKERENAELRKDKERLDWLVDKTSIWIPRNDKDGEEWWVELDYSEPRLDIDKAMEESQ